MIQHGSADLPWVLCPLKVTYTRDMAYSLGTLGEIERLGWRLEHAGYFFMITGETSTARVFVSGDNTAVSGVTVGVYLFRNTRL